jgi:hypothetical protein
MAKEEKSRCKKRVRTSNFKKEKKKKKKRKRKSPCDSCACKACCFWSYERMAAMVRRSSLGASEILHKRKEDNKRDYHALTKRGTAQDG